jgi:L-lactate dehydrogenase complex protein LldG
MSSSRTAILAQIKANQPELSALPDLEILKKENENLVATFAATLQGIGGKTVEVADYEQIKTYISDNFDTGLRIITTLTELPYQPMSDWASAKPHLLQDVELAVISAHLGVAENGSLWVTEELLGQRVAPFIAQYLAIVVNKSALVATMHHAYQQIGQADYGFGTFIAGPSKTADIEQSLVLGAHGARGLTVFLLNK